MNWKLLNGEKLKGISFLVIFCTILWCFNNYWRHAIYHLCATFGSSTSMYALGDFYLEENRIGEAEYWLLQAAERGNSEAQKNLGEFYLNPSGFGIDGEPQYAEAIKWLRKAAEQGDASAQSNLGGCYYAGRGVEQSYIEAVKWFRKAAEQGVAGAQYKLGTCYYNGCGVEKSHAEAIKWYSKAAEQRYPGAKQKLTEVKERLTPKTCTKCSGKGAVTVPATKCTKCQNGRIATRSCRNCLSGWCTNTEALVYPSVKKRYQWIVDTNRNTEYRSVNGDSERLGQILQDRLPNGSFMNFSMNTYIINAADDKKLPTLERLSSDSGKRANRYEFDQLRGLKSLPQGVSKTMGLLHIVPCGKRKGLFGKGYDCANLGKEDKHICSPQNECSECRPCSQCCGDLLCDQCDGSGSFMRDCSGCENGYVSQSMTVICDHCGGDGEIEPEY